MAVNLEKRSAFSDGDVQLMVRAYLECAVWAGVVHDDDDLDRSYDLDDLSPESEALAWDDCDMFLEYVGQQVRGLDPEQVGYDFYLTRNGHGAGFWDRGLGELGESLTIAAKTFGSADLYVRDDNRLHFG